MLNHCMLDLETMGTRPDAAIVAIGAIMFDPDTLTMGDEFYTPIELNASIADGGTVDGGTVKWWMSQSYEARKEIFDVKEGTYYPSDALIMFSNYIERHVIDGRLYVWGNGSDFDNVILASTYDRIGMPKPWNFRDNRCYRTLKNTFPEVEPMDNPNNVAHNAAHDAFRQAAHALAIFKHIRNLHTAGV